MKFLKMRFKELGFRTNKRNFWKWTERGIIVVRVVPSKYGIATGKEFTITVGYGLKEVYDRVPEAGLQKTVPHTDHCHVNLRIGAFNEKLASKEKAIRYAHTMGKVAGQRKPDVWWQIGLPKFDDSGLDEIGYLLFEVALPEMQQWDDRSKLNKRVNQFDDSFGIWAVKAANTENTEDIPPRPDFRIYW